MARITESKLREGMDLGYIRPIVGSVNVNGFGCDLKITNNSSSVRVYGYDTSEGIIGWHIKIYPNQLKRPLYSRRYMGERLPHQPLTHEDHELYRQVLDVLKIDLS